jgi:hypothetical protein
VAYLQALLSLLVQAQAAAGAAAGATERKELLLEVSVCALSLLSNLLEASPCPSLQALQLLLRTEEAGDEAGDGLQALRSLLLPSLQQEQQLGQTLPSYAQLLMQAIEQQSAAFLQDLHDTDAAFRTQHQQPQLTPAIDSAAADCSSIAVRELVLSAHLLLHLLALLHHLDERCSLPLWQRILSSLPKGSSWLYARILHAFLALQQQQQSCPWLLLEDSMWPWLQALQQLQLLTQRLAEVLEEQAERRDEPQMLLLLSPGRSGAVEEGKMLEVVALMRQKLQTLQQQQKGHKDSSSHPSSALCSPVTPVTLRCSDAEAASPVGSMRRTMQQQCGASPVSSSAAVAAGAVEDSGSSQGSWAEDWAVLFSSIQQKQTGAANQSSRCSVSSVIHSPLPPCSQGSCSVGDEELGAERTYGKRSKKPRADKDRDKDRSCGGVVVTVSSVVITNSPSKQLYGSPAPASRSASTAHVASNEKAASGLGWRDKRKFSAVSTTAAP